MITNTGKNILAKYLVGQAPAYASYIAIGCGATPLDTTDTLGDYSSKDSLDFEMFRVPITSRGYVVENGQSKIVFTAELPTEERYEITEVGLWSAGANPTAGAYDSKTIYSFSTNENWEDHVTDETSYQVVSKYGPLDDSDADNIINDITVTRGGSSVVTKTFQTNADNKIFTNQERASRYERCRFLNNIMVIRGDHADLDVSGNHLVVNNSTSDHLHLTGAALDFNKNSPTDELKLAFAVFNKDGESSIQPDEVRILLEFASSDIHGTGQWARFEVILDEVDFSTNRYFVIKKQLQELYKSSAFTWNAIDLVKFYVTVIKNNEPSSDYYVGLDALRLENKTSANPIYGLTGYSVIKNTGAETIIKFANTTNHIEFRFGMDVL
jgi:hypothetical protein